MDKVSDVSNYVSQQSVPVNATEQLPLMHSCECYDSRSIIMSGQLEVRMCKALEEELLYFFYGKPSYPVGEKVKGNRTDIEYCPVCFIVPMNKVVIYKAYPFDTGAFKANKYDAFTHRSMTLDNFELTNSCEGVQQYVKVFFGDNEHYIHGNAIVHEIHDDPCVGALTRILNATGTFEIDERSHTVEIITRNNVSVKDSVECVIMPENLLRDPGIRKFLDQNGIKHIEYTVRRLTAPSRYNEVVFEKAMEYIRTQKGDASCLISIS